MLEDILVFYKKHGFYEEYADELEYFCVKIAFCSSLSRIGRVTDRKLEEELICKTFEFVNANFENYKKNKYFTGKIGLYIKSVSKKNAKFFGRILGKIMKG